MRYDVIPGDDRFRDDMKLETDLDLIAEFADVAAQHCIMTYEADHQPAAPELFQLHSQGCFEPDGRHKMGRQPGWIAVGLVFRVARSLRRALLKLLKLSKALVAHLFA